MPALSPNWATQAFFEKLFRRDFFQTVGPERGHLRNVLLTATQNFATQQWRRQTAKNRGHGLLIQIDAFSAERRMAVEGEGVKRSVSSQPAFERSWGHEVPRQAGAKFQTKLSSRRAEPS